MLHNVGVIFSEIVSAGSCDRVVNLCIAQAPLGGYIRFSINMMENFVYALHNGSTSIGGIYLRKGDALYADCPQGNAQITTMFEMLE